MNRDYVRTAETMWFIDTILASELAEPLSTVCGEQFRMIKLIDSSSISELRNEQPDLVAEYLNRAAVFESVARARSGYAHPSWGRKDGFTGSS